MMQRNWQAGRESHFVYNCVGLFFLHSQQTQPVSFTPYATNGRGHGSEGENERALEMLDWKQQTTINRICFLLRLKKKVHLHVFLGLSALGQPVSHIQNQVTVLVQKVDAGCCAAVEQGFSRLPDFDVSIHHLEEAFLSLHSLYVYASVCVCFLSPCLLSLNDNPVSQSCAESYHPKSCARLSLGLNELPRLTLALIYFLLLAPPSLLSASVLSPLSQASCNFYCLIPRAQALSPPSARLPLLHFRSDCFFKFNISVPFLLVLLLLCIIFPTMLLIIAASPLSSPASLPPTRAGWVLPGVKADPSLIIILY